MHRERIHLSPAGQAVPLSPVAKGGEGRGEGAFRFMGQARFPIRKIRYTPKTQFRAMNINPLVRKGIFTERFQINQNRVAKA